ncbi:YceI family protein [Pricia sp.]|uniref:YceI family protein n=1 Tax=Pricia sp. TaxID=2268138 RepID=UPI0035939D8D
MSMKNRMQQRFFTGFFVFCMLAVFAVHAQIKYIDKRGVIVFEASEKFFEEVKAKNKSVTTILDVIKNEIASLALIRGFRFKNPLMQEHFNENYIESDIYPKVIFRGKISDFDLNDLGSGAKKFTIKGVLEIREQKKSIEPVVQIQLINGVISLQGSFMVLPQDFDIQIPKIVENKIAKEVMVRFDFKLSANEDD